MNRTILNRTLLNTSVLNQSRLNQSGLASQRGKAGGIPTAIRSAMVLWYDIARQGCTNESMQENPVLRDLSGNGHDATCYNFGWTEGSGISTVDYPGALVSDGVDDYAYVEGVPILTKEKGYTVVAKRRILEDPATNIKDAGWINKRKTLDTGAFVIDFFNSVSKDWNTRSFSSNIPIGGSFDIDGEFIYQTSISYNGVQDLKPGDFEDTDTLYLFAALGMSAQISAAFYSLALFDRDLTAEEIEWVKTNLITA